VVVLNFCDAQLGIPENPMIKELFKRTEERVCGGVEIGGGGLRMASGPNVSGN